MSSPALRSIDLVVEITRDSERFRAVDGVSFAVERGRSLGLVGRIGLRQEPHRCAPSWACCPIARVVAGGRASVEASICL